MPTRSTLFSFVVIALVAGTLLISGCLENNYGCPDQPDKVLCGLCNDTDPDNAASGRCMYCRAGTTCSGDICGEYECISPRAGTVLFRVADGQPLPGGAGAALVYGVVGGTYEAWLVVTWENGTELPEGYEYSVEDPVGAPLPAGVSLSPDGRLSGMPLTAGDYVFGICATDTAGVKTCRDVSMPVKTQQVQSPSATPSPSAAPVLRGLFSGTWEGTETLVIHGPEGSFPPGCNARYDHKFIIMDDPDSEDARLLTGTVQVTVAEVNGCKYVVSSDVVGRTETREIFGVLDADGQTLRFALVSDLSATDYVLTVSGGTMHFTTEGCHSPDSRCTCESPDPKCPAMVLDGVTTPSSMETSIWWTGEGTAERTMS